MIAPAHPRLDHQIRDPRLRAIIAIEDAHLGALLVIDAEIDRDPGIAGPFWIGWIGTITGQVAAGQVGGGGASTRTRAPRLRARCE